MGEMTKSAMSGITSGAVGASVNAFGSSVGAAVNNQANAHYARKNARYQDQLQRNFMLDSASMDKESKRRAGVSPWGDGQSQTMSVSTNAQTEAPDLSHVGDKAVEAKQIEMQQELNDSAVNKNNQDAKNAEAQAEQTNTQTEIYKNQLAEQLMRGVLTKNFVFTNRSHFDRYLGQEATDNFLDSNGFGLGAFTDIKNLITNQGQGMRYYENFVEGDKGIVHEYNINPEYQNWLLGKKQVEVNEKEADTHRKQLPIMALQAKAAMRSADAQMINANVNDYLKESQKAGIDAKTAIDDVNRFSLQILQSIDRKISLSKEGPQRDKLVRKKQAILNGYRQFNDNMQKWQNLNGSVSSIGVFLGGVGSYYNGVSSGIKALSPFIP